MSRILSVACKCLSFKPGILKRVSQVNFDSIKTKPVRSKCLKKLNHSFAHACRCFCYSSNAVIVFPHCAGIVNSS